MIGCFSLSDISEFSDDVSLSQMRSEVPHFICDEQSRLIIWVYGGWTCNDLSFVACTKFSASTLRVSAALVDGTC